MPVRPGHIFPAQAGQRQRSNHAGTRHPEWTICAAGLAAGQISIDINYCFNPEALKDPMFEYLFEQAEAGVNNFNVQDVYADTMVQRGLNSRSGPINHSVSLVCFFTW